jgi:uncharacterized protein YybS (DUF2232 family)
VVGILAGFISFFLLFIPITRFQVEPALVSILVQTGVAASDEPEILEAQTTDMMSTVLAYSIIFHMLFGVIMGSVTAVLLDRLPIPRRILPKDRRTSEAA